MQKGIYTKSERCLARAFPARAKAITSRTPTTTPRKIPEKNDMRGDSKREVRKSKAKKREMKLVGKVCNGERHVFRTGRQWRNERRGDSVNEDLFHERNLKVVEGGRRRRIGSFLWFGVFLQ